MRYYVDDGILVEVQWWPDGRRGMRAVQSLASDHFRLLGVRGASDPPLLSASKITNWDTRQYALQKASHGCFCAVAYRRLSETIMAQ